MKLENRPRLHPSYIMTSAEATSSVSDVSVWKWRNWYYFVADAQTFHPFIHNACDSGWTPAKVLEKERSMLLWQLLTESQEQNIHEIVQTGGGGGIISHYYEK